MKHIAVNPTNSTQSNFSRWFSKNWALALSLLFLIFAVLPLLAPILLAYGYSRIAGAIYQIYGFTCHQMPSHSDFIAGHQVAVCQRCNAMHLMMAAAGMLYAVHLFRPPVISGKWFLLFLIPMGIDGGTALVSELSMFIPLYPLWIVGLILIAVIGAILYRMNGLSWQVVLFFAAGPLSLLWVQFVGPHESNWWLRTITGAITAIGVIWFTYPLLDESFSETRPGV